ncbi:EKC/KEOPS complex, subunit Pcc1 [Ceraceosorus bombacis]|uniref:EKC/KEOPS complex, subunit Pcc1 n=1 Tax=Ceraceosorus bombacis TaxID=401625 RepID=A0A0P1BBH6_9BASI|nr:EKC/KEOPS complex, subunit Pcc1 [Ceraceosorus bombacis]
MAVEQVRSGETEQSEVFRAPAPKRDPSPELLHRVVVDIPLPTHEDALRLATILSPDMPLKPSDVHLTFEVHSQSPILNLTIRARTVRQLRLACNSALEDAKLVVDTMAAFAPGYDTKESEIRDEGKSEPAGKRKEGGPEVELGSIGRAG